MEELIQVIKDLEKVASEINIDKEINIKEMKELEDVCNNIGIECDINLLD